MGSMSFAVLIRSAPGRVERGVARSLQLVEVRRVVGLERPHRLRDGDSLLRLVEGAARLDGVGLRDDDLAGSHALDQVAHPLLVRHADLLALARGSGRSCGPLILTRARACGGVPLRRGPGRFLFRRHQLRCPRKNCA
jgi:hypothetical protein